MRKQKILDDILRRFKGNVTISWADLQNELGNTEAYFLTENNIKYLLGDGILVENKQTLSLCMTDKGFAVYTDIDKLGYVAIVRKERRDKWIKNIGFALTVATFLILLYRTIYYQSPIESAKETTAIVGDKTTIDLQTVNLIEIRNHSGQTDTVPTIKKRLSIEQTKSFVGKWNNAQSNGLCKYLPTYWLDLYLKDGTKRTFRVNGKSIKEQKDWCFDLGDINYILQLWTDAK